MNIKITSKDGITLKTQGKYCTEDIKINVGDEVGGGATITKPGGWQGTAVPNSGAYTDIYFNINLSKEDVNVILNQVTFLDASLIGQSGFEFYPIATFGVGELAAALVMKKFSDTDIDVAVINLLSFTPTRDIFVGSDGWDTTAITDKKLPLSMLEEGSFANNFNGLPVGTQNYLIASVFSSTPFTQVNEVIALEGDYDGSSIEAEGTTINVKALIEQKKIPLEIKVNAQQAISDGTHKFITLEGKYINDGGVHMVSIPDFTLDMYNKISKECKANNFVGYINLKMQGIAEELVVDAYAFAVLPNQQTDDYTYICGYCDISKYSSALGMYPYLGIIVNLSKEEKFNSHALVGFQYNTTPNFTRNSWVDYSSDVVAQIAPMIEVFELHLLVEAELNNGNVIGGGNLYQKIVLTKDYDNNGITTFGVKLSDEQRKLLDYGKADDLNLNKFIIFGIKVNINGDILKQCISQIISTTTVSDKISSFDIWFNDYINNLVCQCRFFINDNNNLLYLEHIRGGSTPQESFNNDLTPTFLSLIEEIELYVPNN